MDKVVYILGAGFPACLGLPVMSNFLEKSKDIYFSHKDEYRHFEPIFKMIRELAYIKNFINSDLTNIEEILSILEMGFFVGYSNKQLSAYKKFIKDVIQYYTPKIELDRNNRDIGNWHQYCFGNSRLINIYGYFIANLFQIKINKEREHKLPTGYFLNYIEFLNKKVEYGIITLNYDNFIEDTIDFINEFYNSNKEQKLFLSNDYYEIDVNSNKINYAKLHGSISSEIILPTWNKKDSNKIVDTWKLAYEMLKDANQIRIIGYSLPISDNYVRYLLSIALNNSTHLKKIDIITIDKDNQTKNRYEDLIIFKNFRFKNAPFENFLQKIYPPNLNTLQSKKTFIVLDSDILEENHENFFVT